MRLIVTGAGGQVGRLALYHAGQAGVRAVGLPSADLDITVEPVVREVFDALDVGPEDVVLNCAAYTDVDGAESDEARATEVNGDGARHVARHAARLGAGLIHVSTDYVFAGDARHPYESGDPIAPATAYGRSKAEGERAVREEHPGVRIVRTAWVYTGFGSDFVATIRRLEATEPELTVVDDQMGSPTYAGDLARGLIELATMGPGASADQVLHAVGAGTATWCDLAREVFMVMGADPARVVACGSDEYPRAAPRPAYSVLSTRSWAAAGLTPLRDWRRALSAALSGA